MNRELDPRYVFWFIVGSCGFVFLYISLITFLPIPKGNERFVDIALAFLMGTILGGGMSYYVGASPNSRRKDITTPLPDEQQPK